MMPENGPLELTCQSGCHSQSYCRLHQACMQSVDGRMHVICILQQADRRWKWTGAFQCRWPHLEQHAACMQATVHPIHFMLGSRVGFSGMTADQMALFPVRTNPRWRPPPSSKNFKWPYLGNRSSNPLHVWFQGGVFGAGRSSGAISGSNKSNMAATATLEKFQMAISPQLVIRSTSCFTLKFTLFMLFFLV